MSPVNAVMWLDRLVGVLSHLEVVFPLFGAGDLVGGVAAFARRVAEATVVVFPLFGTGIW